MKKTIFILLFILTMGHTYAQESESYKNHAFRIYGSLGYDIAGIELTAIGFNMGGGLSYTYEFGKIDSKNFMGVSVDTQLGGIGFLGVLFFNLQSSFGMGQHYEDGGRFFFDIIGVGYALINYSSTRYENNKYYKEMSIDNSSTATGILINALSFHLTTPIGFYFSWRNNVMLYNRYNSTDTYESGSVEKFKGAFFDFEYKTYFTFGFDISKKYNPKAYQKRSF